MEIELTEEQKEAYETLVADIKAKKGFFGWFETRIGQNLRKMHKIANELSEKLPDEVHGDHVNLSKETVKACIEYAKLNNKEMKEFMGIMEKVAGMDFANQKAEENGMKDIEEIGETLEDALEENQPKTKKIETPEDENQIDTPVK